MISIVIQLTISNNTRLFNIVIRISIGIIVRIFIYTGGWIESGIRIRIRIRIFRADYIISC